MKIGIALGGGGAKGFAHLGVLRALKDAGVGCDIVAGTSIGAFVGAVYAAGQVERLNTYATTIRGMDIPFLLGPTWPSRGLFTGKQIEKLLGKFIQVDNIEELDKPFAAVSVDLNKAEVHTFKSGNLNRAVRASISIPGLFTPVMFEDKLLADGGILDPVPVRTVKELGADIVIAVDLLGNFAPLSMSGERGGTYVKDSLRSLGEKFYVEGLFGSVNNGEDFQTSILEVIQRSSITAQKRLTEYGFKEFPPDIIIRPPLSKVHFLDFRNGEGIIKIGYKAAQEIIPNLMDLLGKN